MRIILIAGASGSGKTTLARRLSEHPSCIPNAVIATDSYYCNLSHLQFEDRCKYNFDHPDSIDHELLLEHVTKLLSKQSILVPEYDFTTHTRTESYQETIPAPTIIIEGIFALYWEELRDLATVKVFVDTPLEVCLERRIVRDIRERGRTRDSVIAQWESSVEPMYSQYALPTKASADLIVTEKNLSSCTDSILMRLLKY